MTETSNRLMARTDREVVFKIVEPLFFCSSFYCCLFLLVLGGHSWVKMEAKQASFRRNTSAPTSPSEKEADAARGNGDLGAVANGGGGGDADSVAAVAALAAAEVSKAAAAAQRLAAEEDAGLRRAAELAREGLLRFPAEFSLHQTLGTVSK